MEYYDVIVVGASIAGLECAKNLGGSNLNVLIIERNKQIGRKVCAEGIIPSDLNYIPKHLINFDFQRIIIHYKNKATTFFKNKGIISTIERKTFLDYEVKNLKRFSNIEILTGTSLSEITSNNSLKLNTGKKLEFKFLIGADGSTSIVRKYLNLVSGKLEIAIQYIIPKRLEDFEVYLDNKLFGTGYLWIFPNKNYTSIGCGTDLRFMESKTLKHNFDLWLKEHSFDVQNAKFEGALINYDYKGYKFGNIFLAGDAAGLTSGILGKGIYSAFLSGKQIARDILRVNNAPNLVTEWLKKKKRQEKYMFFLKNSLLRKIFFSVMINLLPYRKFEEKAIKMIE